MGKLGFQFLALVAAGSFWACGGDDSRPDNVHVTSGGGSGGGGGGGSGSGGAPCTPDPTKGTKVSGNLITYSVYMDDLQPFAGKAELTAAGATCKWVTAKYDPAAAPTGDAGSAEFLLEGCKAQPQTWVHIYQEKDSSEPVLPTLIAANSSSDLHALDAFGMVRAQGVSEAYGATGVVPDPEKGTVLVQIVGKQGDPVPGVQINAGTAAAPAFPGVAGWQLGGETDSTGVALLLNATSKPFPGAEIAVNIQLGTAKEAFKCPAETGAVTICWIMPTSGF